MPTTTTSIIDTLRTAAPNLQIIGDLDGIERALATYDRLNSVSPKTAAEKLAGMADATHIWADAYGHCLVLFKDADGNTYTDGDPFDWGDAHPLYRMMDEHDAPGSKLSVYGGRVLVINPATDTIIQRVEVDYDTRRLLTGRHRKVRTISRAIRNPMPNMYKPEQVMRIYRRIARNHGIDLEPSNLGNSRVRFKARNAVLANF